MIKGIGNDIIEIERVKIAIEKNPRFLYRIYTQNELNYYNYRGNKIETLAGIFCAKEAVSKAIGTGFKYFKFQDIEIERDENGKPIVKLHSNAKKIYEEKEFQGIFVSISHSRYYATSVCVIE